MNLDWHTGSTGLPHSRATMASTVGPPPAQELTRDVDDLRRPEMVLTHLGQVFLSDDGIERAQDRRMVRRGIELGPVRVGREADEVVGGQLPDELA